MKKMYFFLAPGGGGGGGRGHSVIWHTEVHPKLNILPQKYHQASAEKAKNIGKGCKFDTKYHQISQEFLKIVFTDDFFISFNPELSDFENIFFWPKSIKLSENILTNPKISNGSPRMSSARSDIFFCLKTNWRRVGAKRQKKMSFRTENSAWWKTALKEDSSLTRK